MKILNHPLFILAIVICILVEYFYSKKKGISNYAFPETVTSIALISIDKILGLLTGSDGGPLVKWLWAHRFFDLPLEKPWTLLATFIAAELMYYWNHWYNHHVNIGWATHIMHHSPTRYNLTLGYRLGITRLFSLGWLVFLPLILFGFHPDEIAQCIGVIFLYQFFIHTELVPRLGWLDIFSIRPLPTEFTTAAIPMNIIKISVASLYFLIISLAPSKEKARRELNVMELPVS